MPLAWLLMGAATRKAARWVAAAASMGTRKLAFKSGQWTAKASICPLYESSMGLHRFGACCSKIHSTVAEQAGLALNARELAAAIVTDKVIALTSGPWHQHGPTGCD